MQHIFVGHFATQFNSIVNCSRASRPWLCAHLITWHKMLAGHVFDIAHTPCARQQLTLSQVIKMDKRLTFICISNALDTFMWLSTGAPAAHVGHNIELCLRNSNRTYLELILKHFSTEHFYFYFFVELNTLFMACTFCMFHVCNFCCAFNMQHKKTHIYICIYVMLMYYLWEACC